MSRTVTLPTPSLMVTTGLVGSCRVEVDAATEDVQPLGTRVLDDDVLGAAAVGTAALLASARARVAVAGCDLTRAAVLGGDADEDLAVAGCRVVGRPLRTVDVVDCLLDGAGGRLVGAQLTGLHRVVLVATQVHEDVGHRTADAHVLGHLAQHSVLRAPLALHEVAEVVALWPSGPRTGFRRSPRLPGSRRHTLRRCRSGRTASTRLLHLAEDVAAR